MVTAKETIQEAYRISKSDIDIIHRISSRHEKQTRNWIYGCDMTTYAFCKSIVRVFGGELSVYKVFAAVLITSSFENFQKEIKSLI